MRCWKSQQSPNEGIRYARTTPLAARRVSGPIYATELDGGVRSATPTKNVTVVETSDGYEQGGRHRPHADNGGGLGCGFPLLALLLVLGFIVLVLLLWWWLSSRKPKGPAAVIIQPQQQIGAGGGSPALGLLQNAAMLGGAAVVSGANAAENLFRGDKGDQRAAYQQQQYQNGGAAGVVQTTDYEARKVAKNGQPALVIYTSNGCNLCPAALAEVSAASAFLAIPVYNVERNDIPTDNRPPGYPFIFLLMPNGERVDFSGDRTRDSILDFVLYHLGSSALRNNGQVGNNYN